MTRLLLSAAALALLTTCAFGPRSDADCVVWYDGCEDPCTPLCVFSGDVPDATCDLGCEEEEPPPGECLLLDDGCGWEALPGD